MNNSCKQISVILTVMLETGFFHWRLQYFFSGSY